ncbi:hypothetical protein MXD59_21530 [Frankia sp. Ag45/Mut15]|uniref:Uncharacterized protein n=1 Tax=Frankia umida TaxID=573489 RepID=A0ABT0K3C6_9ACTN|nr:hypothetical protein [Frankia umida]MCK9878321.1 hypothetical protein [Frankia umida]
MRFVSADALSGPVVRRAVLDAEPDAVVHLLTAIPARIGQGMRATPQ